MDEANAASVAIVRGGRVLLIKRARAPYLGLWTLPGGRCERGESAADAAVREVREEVGLAISDLQPVTMLSFDRWLLAVFVTDWAGDAVVVSDEIADHRWVTRAEAAAMETTPDLGDVLRLIPALP